MEIYKLSPRLLKLTFYISKRFLAMLFLSMTVKLGTCQIILCDCNFKCNTNGHMNFPVSDFDVHYRKYSTFDQSMTCSGGWAVSREENITLKVVSSNLVKSSYSSLSYCIYTKKLGLKLALPVYNKYYNVHFVNGDCLDFNRLCKKELADGSLPWEMQVNPKCFMDAFEVAGGKGYDSYLNAVISNRNCDIQFLPPKNSYIAVCPNKSAGNEFIGIKSACEQLISLRRYDTMDRFLDSSYLCKLCAWYTNDTRLCFKPNMETQIVLNSPEKPDSNRKVDCATQDCYQYLCKENEERGAGGCIQPIKYISGRILSTQVVLLYPENRSKVSELLMPVVSDLPAKYQTEVAVKLTKVGTHCWRVTFEFSALFYMEYKMVKYWTLNLTNIIKNNVTDSKRVQTVFFNDVRKHQCSPDLGGFEFDLLQLPPMLLFGYACLLFTLITFVIRCFWETKIEKTGREANVYNESKNE